MAPLTLSNNSPISLTGNGVSSGFVPKSPGLRPFDNSVYGPAAPAGGNYATIGPRTDTSTPNVYIPSAGAQAKVPSFAKPANSIPPSQVAPAKQQSAVGSGSASSPNTGLVGSQNSLQGNNFYRNVTNQLANQQNSPYNQNAQYSIGGLQVAAPNANQRYADKAAEIANNLGADIGDTKQRFGDLATGYLSGKGTQGVAQGLAGLAYNNMSNRISALSEEAQQRLAGNAQGLQAQEQTQAALNSAGGLALTGQAQQQSALGQAGSFAQPVQVSPGNALVTPNIGQEVYSGIGGLTRLGQAQQNISQGQNFQGQGAVLSQKLAGMDALVPTITNFLEQNGLNASRTPWVTNAINTYTAQNLNPAAIATLKTYAQELDNYRASIVAASTAAGLTPTAVTQQVLSVDPSTLSALDLATYAKNLANAGQIQLRALQDAQNASYGGNSGGVTPYGGSQSNPSLNSAYAPNIDSYANQYFANNPTAMGTAGIIMNSGGAIAGSVNGLANFLKGI